MNVSRLALSGLLSLALLPACATSVVLKGIERMDPFFRLRTGSSDRLGGVDGFVRDARGNLGMRARTTSGMSPIRDG